MHFTTIHGRTIDYSNPDVKQICDKDLAFSLSNICRFNGHVGPFYSVAQHSVIVARQFEEPDMKMYGLLHDAHEAFTGDINTPFKQYLEGQSPGIIRSVEDRIDKTVHEYFGIAYPLPADVKAEIKIADRKALATEIRDLTEGNHKEKLMDVNDLLEPIGGRIIPLKSKAARNLFLNEIKKVQKELFKREEKTPERKDIKHKLAVRKPQI